MKNIQQLILVKARGNRCSIYCMEKRGKGYRRALPAMSGYVGKKGVTGAKHEGDMKTPLGLYPVGYAFGRAKHIRTRLPYMQITSKSRWCCDTENKSYNTYTEKRWQANCEDLWKYRREYRYGAVIEYNTGRDKRNGAGSAIFLHCKNSPTAGCVAGGTEDIKHILKWLDVKKAPHIFIKGI